ALTWYRRAVRDAYARHPITARASALNNLGIFYSGIARYDSAMCYYHSALQVLGSITADTILYCSIQDNIAQEHERTGDCAFALKTYRFNDGMYEKWKRLKRIIPNRLRLMNALRKTGHNNIDADIQRLNDFIEENRKSLDEEDVLKFYQFAKTYFF